MTDQLFDIEAGENHFSWGEEPPESDVLESPIPDQKNDAKQESKAERSTKIGELTFDLETIPDQDRMELFESFLGDLPARYPARGFDEIDDDLPDIMSGNVGDIESWLKAVSPAPEVVDLLRGIENEQKKPRKGVHDALDKILKSVDDYDNALADRCKLLSTTPEFCSICALGFAIDGEEPVGILITNEDEERQALAMFWEMAMRADVLVGFNIVGFDLPVIITRSIILGVTASRMFDLKWGKGVCDIYLQRFGGRGNTDKRKPGKLKDLAAIYGIEVPAGDFHGGQIAEAMETEEGREKIIDYVKSDVEITRELRELWSGYFCS